MKVDVYKNLQQECISVRSREKENRGRVVKHTDEAKIRDVEFVVQPAGRQRVLQEERKNVHAFARGVLTQRSPPDKPVREVTYDPYQYEHFVERRTENPIQTAEFAVVRPTGVKVYG